MVLSKDAATALTLKAREAQRRHRWAEAEALWRELLAAKPIDRAARAGLGSVLLARGRIDEARAIAVSLCAESASDAVGLTLAARIAAEEADWPAAAEAWRAVLAVKDDNAVAITGLGNALLALPDLAEADKFAEQLSRRFAYHPYGTALAARIAAARGDAGRAAELWRAAASRFADDKSVRREYSRALTEAGRLDEAEDQASALYAIDREEGLTQLGNVMARRRPDDDHTDFWKDARAEFPANAIFLRREAASAMKAGRSDEAIAAMDLLLNSGDASLPDAGLVVGLAHILAARGDGSALRRMVRAYLKGLQGSAAYRLAALRLSRVIFTHFAAHDSRRRISYRARTWREVAHTPLKPKTRALLERSIVLEENLAAEGPALFDTDVSRAECLAFVALARERAARREPFSFVRINDAESNAFAYEPALAEHFAADAEEREIVWWGRGMADTVRAAMAARVAEAAWNADAIGIPTFARILRDLHLQENNDLSGTRTGRGLRAGLATFERWRKFRPAELPPPLFTSANLHQDLQRWNLYGALFDGIGEVALVSCHPDLPEAMKRKFGVTAAANIVVPPRHYSMHAMTKRLAGKQILPEVIDDVVAQVRAVAPGRMVLVGAGYLGKWIVHQAKAAGGIALDIGSVADYWVGLKTRSYQDLA